MTKYREILRLSNLGLSQQNIADSCGVSKKTVNRVLKKAKELNISWPLDANDTDEVLAEKLFPSASKSVASNILDEYDVAIFMARKAICLYSAMMNNGELRNTSCHVISSRVIDYDSLERFQNQKIAVIDDVVVKGESINQVALKLSEAGVNADYYVAVCEVSFAEQFVKNGVFLNESFTYYTKQEVYQLAGLITQYIEASMCSFNIDSPIYDMTDNADELRDLLCENGSAILTSNIQRKYGIQSKVLYFGLRVNEECKGSSVRHFLSRSIQVACLTDS